MKESFVPLDGAQVKGGEVALGVAKGQVKDAPHVGRTADHLDSAEEDALRSHYMGRTAGRGEATRSSAADARGRDAGDAAGPDAMTRSEERLRVGTESREVGTARLRKYVVTEDQQVTVPVSHEEVRLEREPIAGAGGRDAATIGEETHEVTLHAECPVVGKTTEAVEQVRLNTRTVTEDETVSGTVRKEQIEVHDPSDELRDGQSR